VLPRTKYTMSFANKKHPVSGKMTSVFNIKGTDWLSDVTVATTDGEGKVLYDTLIHPKAFQSTRLSAFASLFDKYIFKRFSVVYHPSAAATVSGAMLGYCDYDPDADVTQTLKENVRKGASHYGMKLTHLFDKEVWSLKEIAKDALFFCDPSGSEDRLVYQGRFLLLCAETTSSSLDSGELTIDFDVDFYISQIENAVVNNQSWYEATGTPTSPTASIPYGSVVGATGIVVTNASNMPVTYSSPTYSTFYLPSVAVDTVFYIMTYAIGTGLSSLNVADLNTGIAWTVKYTLNNTSTGIAIISYATVKSDGTNQTVRINYGGLTTCTTNSIFITPIPTAITLAHNNKKEMFSMIEGLQQKVDDLEALMSSQFKEVIDAPYPTSTSPRDPGSSPRRKMFT